MSPEEKLSIARQLREYINELRTLKGGFIGSLDGGPVIDLRNRCVTEGPFTSEADFNTFLLSEFLPQVSNVYHDMAQRQLRTDHDIVFTHADLSPRNIMVKDGQIVAIIDWEAVGWYPEYWVYLKTFHGPCGEMSWIDFMPYIFPQAYEQELITDRFFAPFLRHNY